MISKRLETIASMVPSGKVVFDVGSDHALLPCYLVENGISTKVYAGDNKKGPLESALKNISVHGLNDKIIPVLSDGLNEAREDVEVVIIAGMGYHTAIDIIEKGGYDSLMTVNRDPRKLGKIIDGKFTPWNYEFGMRSQDMEPLYYENGLLYISSKEQILNGKIMGDNMYPMIMNHIFGEVDIDTPADMAYAEYVLQHNI